MAIGGAFLGGGVEVVPAGSCKLELEILTEDRANLNATFTIKGTSTYSVTAGADGRAVYTVPAGQTYTVSVNTTGYDNIASQTVIAESGTVRYVRFEAFAGRVKRSGDTMTGMLNLTGGCLLSTTPDKAVTDVPIFSTMREIDVSSVNSYQVAGSINMHWSGWKYSGGVTNWRDATHTAMNIIADTSAGSQTILSVWQPNDGSAGFVTYPSWSPGTNDNSDKIMTIKMANSLPSLVHTTGNETIGGTKTFTSGIYHKGTNPVINQNSESIIKGTKPSTSQISGIRYGDTNGSILGGYRYVIRPSGDGELYNEIVNFDGSATATLKLLATADGMTYATAPTPSSASDNSTKIATTAWVNTASSVVHTTGNETISGIKTFTANPIIKSNLTLSWQGPPSVENINEKITKDFVGFTTVGSFLAKATNGEVGGTKVFRSTPGGFSASITNLIASNSSGTEATISLVARDDGVMYAQAPSTASGAIGNEIATADWSLSKFQRKITYGTGDPPSGGQAGDIYIKI